MSEDMPIRRLRWPVADPDTDPESLVTREWLVTNGLGGYASGTVPGVMTRRYHGLLIAALPAPLGRIVMLTHLAEQLRLENGRRIEFGGRERAADAPDVKGTGCLVEFRLEAGLPVWRYDIEGIVLEKRLFLVHRQNTVHVMYELLEGADAVTLALRPSINFRPQEAPVSEPLGWPYEFRSIGEQCEVLLKDSDVPPLRLFVHGEGATFTLKGMRLENVLYPVEESRGYQGRGALWSPGYFRVNVPKGGRAVVVASSEPFESITALEPHVALAAERERRGRLIAAAGPEARTGVAAELVLAADQFVITPVGRAEEAARAEAAGEELRTIIAGYHWFTDWGRDTMISLEGLTLVTGRAGDAGYILRTFAHHVRDGLIPNMFPEGENQGLYHTADATLWFFHAIDRYRAYANDDSTFKALFPVLKGIVEAHRCGTRFGIRMDEKDGLLTQGAEGYQLTWMDAKVDGWVVTPRRGKAVEINALWYNALRLMEAWARELNDDSVAEYGEMAERTGRSFNERFWYEAGGYLYDVVDVIDLDDGHDQADERAGNDISCRPNQLLAVALPHPVLAQERWESIVRIAEEQLLTPVGLRSLAPGDPQFKPRYFGDLRTRDAAYHQGTVWGWLIGPFVDAWLKVHPDDRDRAASFLDGFAAHLDDACIGSISEIFDAEAPFTPRGCIAQAWSVAEVLRILGKLTAAATPFGMDSGELGIELGMKR